MRWNPCAVIRYRVNYGNAPAGALTDIKSAVARVAWATGMTFAYDGATTVVPTTSYGVNAPLSSRPPLVFAWAAAGTGTGKSNLLSGGNQAGVGGWRARGWSIGSEVHKTRIFTGFVVLNTSSKGLPAGFGSGRLSRGGLLMHELAHAVGLNHVADRSQVMNPVLGPNASWGAGDLAGLRKVGRPAGCIS